MRVARFTWIVVMVALVAACSTARLGYNNADWLVAMYMDRYFDLKGEQKDWFKARMAEHVAWHRRAELPRYHRILTDMRTRIENGLEREDLDILATELAHRYLALADRLLPDMARLTASLDTEQIDHFERRLQRRFEEEREEEAKARRRIERDGVEKARRRRVAEAIERIEDWTGRLDDEQRAHVAALMAPESDGADAREDDTGRRERRTAEYIAALRAGADAAELEGMLREWWMGFIQERLDEGGKVEMRGQGVKVILGLDGILTDRQRARVVKRLDRYRRDVAILAGRDAIEAIYRAD